jgi:amidohydrolase
LINKQYIQNEVGNLFEELLQIRRHLHANPELSYAEFNTAQYISSLLTKWGIENRTGVGGNGIVGLIKGKNPEKNIIALRADMDALPINEQNQVEYKSVNKGIMHACGHDVHMTCLLGTAKFLSENKTQFEGTVKLIFQHAEEKVPGGAIQMIEAGVLENPKPSAIYAQHVLPELETGKIGFKSGKFMASSDEINLYITGSGGHAAMPEKNDDTILTTAHIIVALQHIVSRSADPQTPTVLSFGQIVTNGAMNIFPEEVSVHGTFRTYDEEWREKAHQLIRETAQNTAKAFGMACNVVIDKGYPFLVNDHKLTENARISAIEYLGEENVVELKPRMTVEDFARYSHIIPACFYRLGTANSKDGINSGLHTPTFNVDEKSIATGTGLMIWIALNQLSKIN